MEPAPHRYLPWIPVVGAIAGFLQAVPLHGGCYCCCTPWVLFGGVVAALVVADDPKRAVPAGEGAWIGLLTGLVAGAVGGALAFVAELLSSTGGLVTMMLRGQERSLGLGVASHLMMAGVTALLYLVLCPPITALGGLIGSAITQRRAEPPAPPPPPPP